MTISRFSLDTKNSTFPRSSGERYELQMGRHSRSLAPLFIAFAASRAKGKVLDVGCGTGHLAVELASKPAFTSIEALDLSRAYIAYAKAREADARINFQTADACNIPFADNTFDLTLSMLVLAFIPEPQRAVREMVRVTRPGGTVSACMWDLRGGLVFGRMFWDTAAVLDPKAAYLRAKALSRPITRQGGIAGELKQAGLQNVQETALTMTMTFVNFDDFWAPLGSGEGMFATYVAAFDVNKRRFKKALRLAYLDGSPDGPRTYFASAWAARGTRQR
ncbi:class I SAM-dependent methyltransferase [Bradyrhizobium diazoefficiens]|nr:class I SAM-dependent methyltransferase [Bradyrhizobium diazoefficiens]QQN62326.1 class I SAM-dependent methyltransferase [Bradyrhizobium diazoefficiens]